MKTYALKLKNGDDFFVGVRGKLNAFSLFLFSNS